MRRALGGSLGGWVFSYERGAPVVHLSPHSDLTINKCRHNRGKHESRTFWAFLRIFPTKGRRAGLCWAKSEPLGEIESSKTSSMKAERIALSTATLSETWLVFHSSSGTILISTGKRHFPGTSTAPQTQAYTMYRGTSLTRKRSPVRPYRRPI